MGAAGRGPPRRTRRGRWIRVADATRATPAQVALAWLLQRSPVMLPIPGTSSIAHFDEGFRAAELELPAEDLAALDEAAG